MRIELLLLLLVLAVPLLVLVARILLALLHALLSVSAHASMPHLRLHVGTRLHASHARHAGARLSLPAAHGRLVHHWRHVHLARTGLLAWLPLSLAPTFAYGRGALVHRRRRVRLQVRFL